MRSTQLLHSVCFFAAASSAWPWPAAEWRQPLDAVKRELAPLVAGREAATSYDLSYSSTQGNTATTETSATTDSDASTTTDDSSSSATSDASTTGSDASSGTTTTTGTGATSGSTGSTTGTTGSSKSTGKTTTTSTSSVSISSGAADGGISMITPSAGATTYYKIADYVTFAWNYTSLSVTPSAIDVLASCSLNSETYTIATNLSVTSATQAVTWDTGAFQQTAAQTLLTGTYTLIIHDAAKAVSATASPGYLGTVDTWTFGMYVPQPYVPLDEYVCATCNAAMSSIERQTLGFTLGMVALTVLSFSWFAGVAGLW